MIYRVEYQSIIKYQIIDTVEVFVKNENQQSHFIWHQVIDSCCIQAKVNINHRRVEYFLEVDKCRIYEVGGR